MVLSKEEREYLLSLARNSIKSFLERSEYKIPRPPTERLLERRGVFVTLTIDGELRGCIGTLEPVKSIVDAVWDCAQEAAFYDPRFPVLSRDELPHIKIEISILSPLEEIRPKDETELVQMLRPKVHGLVLRKGYAGATFLPQVWEQLPTHELFLSHLCQKAGLGPNEWKRTKEMKFFVYTVEEFSEH